MKIHLAGMGSSHRKEAKLVDLCCAKGCELCPESLKTLRNLTEFSAMVRFRWDCSRGS